MKKKKHFVKAAAFLCALGVALIFSGSILVKAADETIDFRILSTSDLHGQISSVNYDNGEEDPTIGLSKLYTLIKEERKKVGKNNTLLVDAGDCLYDYSTNYIYENHPDVVQPIYRAMNLMQYDCITPGNHDFDYPWDYLYRQLKDSGLLNRTFAANAVFTESGLSPFRTSAIYTRRMTTSAGRQVNVKIGIIGATKASFSSRRFRYSGFLDGSDLYQSVKKEAASLKKQGADIIIAFIHGGVGLTSGSDTTLQAGARIAGLADVNAVICAHTHEEFPSADKRFDSISYVDESKGLIHGTPVVQAGSHAEAFGIIKLILKVGKNDKVYVKYARASVKKVKSTTKEDSHILDVFSEYAPFILNSHDPTTYPIDEGITYTNADCIVQDSDLFQLMNDAKTRYAASYVADYRPEYKDYPIVAVTVNYLDSKNQTIELKESFTEKDISSIISESSSSRSSGYIHLYEYSGADLIEWLEYSASIYGQVGTGLPSLLSDYAAKNPDVSSLTRTVYVKDWSMFFNFDGISYDIDLSKRPRYNANGVLIHYSRRVSNITCNGVPVTPDMNFILVMDSLETRYKFMPTDDKKILDPILWDTSKDVLMNFIKDQTSFGPLNVKANNNWHLIVPEGYRFVVAVPKEHDAYIQSQDWCIRRLKKGSLYYYYLGEIKQKTECSYVLMAPGSLSYVNRTMPIEIITSLAPGTTLEELLFVSGNVSSVDDVRWETQAMPGDTSTLKVVRNGQYSVRMTDSDGFRSIGQIYIDNICPDMLERPRVNVLTNRIDKVTGTAVPFTTIYVALPNGEIAIGLTDEDGNFSVPIPLPRAYDTYAVWALRYDNKVSPVTEYVVKKTGANRPTANELKAGDTTVTGTVDPYVTLSLRIGSKVYVGIGEAEAYKKSSVYKTSHKITETEIIYAGDGTFTITLPEAAETGQTYYLYATDRNGNASRIVNLAVPVRDPVTDFGYVK